MSYKQLSIMNWLRHVLAQLGPLLRRRSLSRRDLQLVLVPVSYRAHLSHDRHQANQPERSD